MTKDFSVQPLRSLCLCGSFYEEYLTTETQRPQRLHRGDKSGLSNQFPNR
jgi:hypothetical protein